ncbi:MAG: hypothetical protein ABI402_13730 [Ferruginibacter sp.]
MKIFHLPTKLLIVTVVMLIASCKKNNVDDSQNNNNNSAPSNIYISKITTTDTISSNPTILSEEFFSYDNQKRLTTIVSYHNGDTVHNFYAYNASDTLPYTLTRTEANVVNTGINRDTLVTYFFYDSQARRLKDSVVSSGVDPVLYGSTVINSYFLGVSVERYSYSGNTMYGELWDTTLVTYPYNPPLPSDILRDTANLDADGDIISLNRFNAASFVAPTIFFYTDQYTYDNHHSPFARFRKFSSNVFPTSGTSVSYNDIWGNKNYTSTYESIYDNMGYNYGNGLIYDITGSYEYDTNNLPVMISNSPFLGQKVHFEYVTL